MDKFLLLAWCIVSINAYSQQSVIGSVFNKQSQPLTSISVSLNDAGTTTDENGLFSFTDLKEGDYLLVVSGIGYAVDKRKIKVNAGKPVSLHIVLKELPFTLQNVEIIGRKASSYKNDYSFSATKTATSVIDIPQTISTVTKELIRDQQSMRLKDVVQNVAGINQFSTYDDITMRGFRNSTSRLVNGLRTYNNFWTSPLLVNIERVEVIKGPAGATFANTNPGGTINMVTKKPLAEYRNALSFSAGSFNTFRAISDFTGPMNKEKTLLFRLNLGYENAESFRDNYFNKNFVVAPSVSFIPKEGTRFNADVVYAHINTILDRGRPIFQNDRSLLSTPVNFNLTQPGDYLNQENLSLNFSFAQQLTRNLSFNASYLKFRFDEALNEHGFNGYITRDSIELYFTDRLTKAFSDNLTAYFTLDAVTGKASHKILIGYDYIQGKSVSLDRYAEGVRQGVPNFSLTKPEYYKRPVQSYSFPQTNYSSYGDRYYTNGFYIQDQIRIGKLQALLSMRQEFYRFPKDQSTYYGAYGTPVEKDIQQNALLPKIGLVYSLKKNINLYATYTRGFEAQDIYSISNPRAGGPFDPLTSSLAEGGAKGEFFSKKLFAGLAVYQIIQNNVLVSANDPSNPDLLIQRGQERARGAEIELAGNINSNWSINGGYAYNKAIISEDAEGDPDKLVGKIKENAPLHNSNLWVKYESKESYLNGLGMAAGFSQVSRRNTFDRELQLPGYIVFNAALFYNLDKFRLSLNVNNIADKTHWTGGYNFQRNYPGAPRNMLFTVGYDF